MSSLAAITDYLLNQSVHIIVLFAAVAAVCFALRKKTAHVRYLLWLIIIAKCLVPSLITVSLAILPSAPTPTSSVMIEAPLQMDTGFTVQPKMVYSAPAAEPTLFERLAQIPPKVWFMYLWIAGALLYALVVIAKAVHLNKYLVRKRKPIPEGLQNEFDGFIEKLPACYMVKGIAQPFVWGLVKGSIYLPANFIRSTTPEHRRQIVSHEAGHVTRLDPLVNLLQIIAQTVFFFHPLVWIANRIIRAEREKCCDEIAIAGLNAAPRDYGSAIVETLVKEYESTMPIPSMAIAGPIKNIEDRIKTIMNPDKKFYKRPTVIALMSILLIAALAVPTSFALTKRSADIQGYVKDFFQHNYKDISARKTIEWGEPVYHDNGNVSIRYKYEATIWDKDIVINNEVFTFDEDGEFVSVKKIRRGQVGSTKWMQELVEHFFNNNYRDITARNSLKWGEAVDNKDGTFSIRYKYEATIWDKDKLIQNKVFTFDKDEKYISAKDVEEKEGSGIGGEDFREQKERLGPSGKRPTGQCSISGKVVSAETGEPIGHAMAYLFYLGTHDAMFIKVASDGSFEFKDIPPGPHSLKTIHTKGYQDAVYNPESKSGNLITFTLKDGERRDGVIIKANSARSISGKVFDENGQPMTDQSLTVIAWTKGSSGSYGLVSQNRISADGSYSLDGLASREFYVMAFDFNSQKKDDYYSGCYYPSTFSRDEAELISFDDAQAFEGVDIQLKTGGGYVLKGSVTDENGNGIAKTLVTVHHTDMLFDRVTAYTDDSGDYYIDTLGPGEFMVHTDAKPFGFVRARSPLTIKGKTSELNFTLKQGVAIYGEFVDENGDALEVSRSAFGHVRVDGDPDPQSSSWSGVRNKYSVDVHREYASPFVGGYGDYYGEAMEYTTESSFVVESVIPGKTYLKFYPKIDGMVVKEMWSGNEEITQSGIVTNPGDVIDDVVIVVGQGEVSPQPDCQPTETSDASVSGDEINEIVNRYRNALSEKVTVDIDHSPQNDRLSVQYAVIAICDAAGVPYQWDKSAELADPERRLFTDQLHIKNQVAAKVLADMLGLVGLHYELDDNGLYLSNQKQVSIESSFLLVKPEFMDEIKDDIGFEFSKDSQDGELIDAVKASFLIRATMAHDNSKLLTAPKVVVLDGESAVITIMKEQMYVTSYEENDGKEPTAKTDVVKSGIVVNAMPVITEDGENILLEFDAELTEVLDMQESMYKGKYPVSIPELEVTSVASKVVVPDGGTLMLDGGQVTSVRQVDTSVPILSKLPVLGGLFSGTSEVRKKQVLLVFVKPSIVKPKAPVANK